MIEPLVAVCGEEHIDTTPSWIVFQDWDIANCCCHRHCLFVVFNFSSIAGKDVAG